MSLSSLKLIAAGIALAAVIAAFFYGRSVGVDSVLADQAREDQIVAQVTQAAQKAAASEIAKIEIRQTTIREKVEREIIEKPIYRDCRHDDATVRLLNDALAGEARTQPPDSSVLPQPDTPPR